MIKVQMFFSNSKFKIVFLSLIFFFAFFFFGAVEKSFAAARYWVGTTSTDASNTANWSSTPLTAGCAGATVPASVPVAVDTVTFDADCDNNATFGNSLTVSTITIESGYSGTVTNNADLTTNSTFTQNSGTFNGGSGTVTVTGAFSLSGGTFNASSATTTFSSTFTATSTGSFVHNGGLVYLRGNATIDVNSSLTFNKLSIWAPPANTRTIATGDTLVVNSDLVFEQGVVNTGSITAKGNFSTGTTTSVITGSATVNFVDDGSNSSRTLTFNGGNLPNIVLNNPYASVVYNGRTDFSSLNIQNISGTFNLGTYGATVAATYTQSGGTFNGGSGTITHTGAVTISGGTYNGVTSAVTMSGTFTLSGGTFNASTATTTFNNGFTYSAGTFYHSTGTVSLGAAAAYTIDVPVSGINFYNLTIERTGASGSRTIATGDTLTIEGSLIIGAGGLNTGSINARGNITFLSTATGGSATINATSTSSTPITITFNGGSVPNIILNNPYAIVSYSGDTTFASLNLQNFSGAFSLGSYNLTSTSAFTQSGGSFNGGSAAITLSNGFTLSGGTFNASTATTTINAGFTHTAGGTFYHSTGTVSLGASGASTIDVATTTEIFHNLTIIQTGASGSRIISSGDTLVVNGTLNVASAGGITTGSIIAKGDVIFAATASGGSATITVSHDPAVNPGLSTRNVTFNGGLVPNIVINNPYASISYNNSTTFASLNLQNFSNTLNLNSYTFTVTGTFTQSGGTFTAGSGNLSIGTITQSSGTLNLGSGTTTVSTGSFTLSGGNLNAGSGVIVLSGSSGTGFVHTAGGTFNAQTSTFVYNSGNMTTNTNNVGGVGIGDTFYNFIINITNPTSNLTNSGGTITVSNNFSQLSGGMNSGTYNLKGPIVTFSATGASSNTTSQVNIDGTNPQSITFSGTNASNITIDNTQATVFYNSSVSFTSLTVANLSGVFSLGSLNATTTFFTLSGGTFNAGSGTMSVGVGNFTLSGGTFNAGSATIIISGSSNSGFVHTAGGIFNAQTSTFIFNSGNTAINSNIGGGLGDTFYNFSITIVTASNLTNNGNPINVTNNFSQISGRMSGGVYNLTGPNITFGPTAGSAALTSVVNINGTSAQNVTFSGGFISNITINNSLANISFTGATTFSSLAITNSTSPITITFAAGLTQTITGALTVNGTANSYIFLRSSLPNTQWRINPQGTRTLSYLDVRDSNNTNASAINTSLITGYVNRGNNTNWSNEPTAQDVVERTWSGVVSSVWSTAGNWYEGSAPTATNTALFTSASAVNANFDSSAVSPQIIQISGYSGTIALQKDMLSVLTYTQSSGTFNTAGYNLGITGTTTISGGTFTGSSGTHSFSNLTFSGGTFNASTATTTVSGNFTKSGGTFNANGGIFALTGTTNTVTGNTTFANLTKSVTSSSTLNFAAGNTTIVTGTTTLKGTSGNILSLRSTSGGTQWLLDPRGGLDLAYLNVKDSNNVNASSTNINPNIAASDYPGITDGGNNTNWTFTLPTITMMATGTQNATTTLPVTLKYMGGAFAATANTGTSTITSISLTQIGSLPTSYISNISLSYKTAVNGLCSNLSLIPSGTTAFNAITAANWTGNKATVSGTMPVGTTPVCTYVSFSLTGALTLENILLAVNLVINDPSSDIISSGTTILPATVVDITGSTLVYGGSSGTPGITLSIASSSISTGTSTTLTWSTTNSPDRCLSSGNNGTGGAWTDQTNQGSSGTALTGTFSAGGTYTFILSCSNGFGTTSASRSVTVTHPNAPRFTFTTASSTIQANASTTLSWNTSTSLVAPNLCSASGGWSGSKATSTGSESTTGLTESTAFYLTCSNGYGTTTKGLSVSVPSTPVVADTCLASGEWQLAHTACNYNNESNATSINTGVFGDSFSLSMADPTIDSTDFYIYNDGISNALYMRQGTGDNQTLRKLTADNITITTGTFTKLGCVGNECRGIKINLELQKTAIDGSLQNFTIEKTFKNTASVRKNSN